MRPLQETLTDCRGHKRLASKESQSPPTPMLSFTEIKKDEKAYFRRWYKKTKKTQTVLVPIESFFYTFYDLD